MLKQLIKAYMLFQFYWQRLNLKAKSVARSPAFIISTLVLTFVLAAPIDAFAAFNIDTAKDKVLSFVMFCILIAVASAVVVMLVKSNVMGAITLAFAGAIIYGLLDPGAFSDVANGIKNFLGIGGGSTLGTGGG